jgi:long-chain acyl-CoA synthetase
MNLRLMLEKTVRRYGGKTAVAMGERRLSYAQLDEASNKVANALLGMGVKKGDRVVMLLPNSPEFAAIYFGIVKIGGIAVPLDPRYRMDELTSLFNSSQPKVLVSESPTLEPMVPVLSRFSYIKHVIDLSGKYAGKFISYQEMMASGSAQPVKLELEPGDIAHIAYTSGPLLRPRGVMLSHQSLVQEVAIASEGFRQTSRDIVVLFALPMHHAFGLVVVLLTAVAKGSTVIMMPGLVIDSLFEVIEREKATIFMGVPFIHTLVVTAAEEGRIHHDLSSLRLWGTAGAAIPVGIAQKIKQYFGLSAVDFWGMTESSAFVTCQSLNGAGKLGSVGKILPGWELKIVDSSGRELPLNQPGEIIVRGPIMKGYYNNPQATAAMIKDGWLYTGDLGRVDEDGEVFLTGRSKDIIIVKGQNVYPSDIEEVLYTHSKVAEAAVVGMPDEIRGETIIAFINLKKGEEATEAEIKHFCREHMADYKVPRQVSFVDSLPKTAAGKIDKKRLKRLI